MTNQCVSLIHGGTYTDKDDGFDYLVSTLTGDVFHDVPHFDNKGRQIVRLGIDVTLPFNIYCFGEHMTFTKIGKRVNNIFELRMFNGRMMIFQID